MLDLMKIARTEAEGGDLLGLLSGLFEDTDVRPTGFPDAVMWQGEEKVDQKVVKWKT